MTPWLIILAAFVVVVGIIFLIAWCIDLHLHAERVEEKITPEKVLLEYQNAAYEAYKIAHFYWVRYNRLHKTAYDYEADDYESLVEMLDVTMESCLENIAYQDTYAADVVQCIRNGLHTMESSRADYRRMIGKEPAFPAVDW